MSTQSSKAALMGQEKADFVVASTRAYRAPVSAELSRIYGGVLAEGEQMPDWDLVQELDARLLEGSTTEVAATDQQRRAAMVNRTQLRKRSRVLARTIRTRISSLRSQLRGLYGDDVLPVVGLDKAPAVARKPLAVLRQAEDLSAWLRDPDLQLPPPPGGLKPVDPAALAAELEPGIRTLAAVLEAINQTFKHNDEPLIAKHEALDRLRRRYVNVTRQVEAKYRLAGLDEIADRLRPLVRAAGRPAPDAEPEPVDETPEPVGETPESEPLPTSPVS